MIDVKRITPTEARQKTQSAGALLVLTCESEELCKAYRLEGALSL